MENQMKCADQKTSESRLGAYLFFILLTTYYPLLTSAAYPVQLKSNMLKSVRFTRPSELISAIGSAVPQLKSRMEKSTRLTLPSRFKSARFPKSTVGFCPTPRNAGPLKSLV